MQTAVSLGHKGLQVRSLISYQTKTRYIETAMFCCLFVVVVVLLLFFCFVLCFAFLLFYFVCAFLTLYQTLEIPFGKKHNFVINISR